MEANERFEQIAGRLGELHKRVRRMQEKRLAEYNISLLEYHIIIIIMRAGNVSQSEIAAALDVDKALVSRQINAMEKKGLLLREYDPDCRRKNVLSLSESTQQLIPKLKDAHRRSLEYIFSDLDERQINELQIVLEGLVNKL